MGLNYTFGEAETPVSDEVVTTTETSKEITIVFTPDETNPTTEEKTPAASQGSIPEANAPPTQESGGCGKGCIAAAVVCPTVGVFAIVGIALFIRRRRRRRRESTEAFDPVF